MLRSERTSVAPHAAGTRVLCKCLFAVSGVSPAMIDEIFVHMRVKQRWAKAARFFRRERAQLTTVGSFEFGSDSRDRLHSTVPVILHIVDLSWNFHRYAFPENPQQM